MLNTKNIIIALCALGVVYFLYGKLGAVEIVNMNNNGVSIVCLGDSLTYGYGAGKGASFPDLLAKKVDLKVVNLGVNGDKSTDGLRRINSVFEHDPYMVLIEFGGNDFMKQTSFEETISAVGQMVDIVQQHGAIAVVVDTGGNLFMNKYSKAYKKLAKEKGAVFVPAILKNILNDPKLKADQIHPNAEGYKIVADRVYKGIEKYLRQY
ncbi:lysophospholipase L1-like esterase [Elusimicrobium simillimum]|uniref:GDSL-type esterase/lipase family protein n=1 Tax=Elusimicrobium simillimum TaxID=3143438 RepID=UPI003C70190D